MTPAFHFNILKKYNEIINEHADSAVKEILSQGDETAPDLLDFFSDYTLNVICGKNLHHVKLEYNHLYAFLILLFINFQDSAMGVSLKGDSTGNEYKDAVHRMGAIIFYR